MVLYASLLLTVLTLCVAKPEAPQREKDGRVIHGTLASKGQFTYQVAVAINFKDYSNRWGGALISTDWVLTAAHMLSLKAILSVTVVLGSTTMLKELDPDQVSINASKWVVHPSYNPDGAYKFDIALVKLNKAATLTAKIKPIALNSQEIKAGTVAIVSGWGLTSGEGFNMPNDLRYIGVKVISQGTCNEVYGGAISDMMCTVSNDDSPKTICYGDAGDPLVSNTSNGIVHIGVVSFGYGVCGTTYPDVYSKTDYNRAWIRNVTGI